MNDEDKNPVVRYAVIVITVIVSALILFAMMPVVGVANTESHIGTNGGASDLKFTLEKNRTFQRSYTITLDDTIEITGGVEDMLVTHQDMIVYADENLAIYCKGYRFYLIADDYLCPCPSIGQWFTIKGTQSEIKITPGYGATVGTLTFAKPHWCYLPNNNGEYAYFKNGTEVNLAEGSIEAVAGIYAGWGAYNRLAYTLSTDRTEDFVSTAEWLLEDAGGSTSYTAPGTIPAGSPVLTDGDWGYVLYPDSETATIVSYSGQGGGITVPATLGGYPVLTVGTSTGQIFNVNITSLVISEGIKNIDFRCFSPPEGYEYTGPVSLPSSLEYISSQAFRFAHFTGNLVIPENVGYIGYNAFDECSFTSLVVKGSATPLSNAYKSTAIREVLNLSDAEYTAFSYGLAADSVSDNLIVADGFIANVHYTYKEQRSGVITMLFWLIPLVFLIGIAIYFINRINNRNERNGGWR